MTKLILKKVEILSCVIKLFFENLAWDPRLE